jgi:CheY-like chemotaxis protein
VSHKLLLADDSLTIQRVIELTFSGEEIQVVAVGDGEQAIARIPTERPDIVLADIAMPKRSGYDVAAFIKGHPDFKHIPVLLLAGAFEPVDDAKAEQVGCDGVLVKPFEPQQVVARVRELLEGARGSPTQAATATVPRPVERLTQPRAAEAVARTPEAGAQGPKPAGDQSLDDYFDKLDAAFAKMGSAKASPSASSAAAADSEHQVPTLDRVLSQPAAPPIDLPVIKPPVALTPLPSPIATPPVEPPETPSTLAPGPPRPSSVASGPPTPSVASGFSRKDDGPGRKEDRTIIADAFSALIALEQGEPGAKPVRLTTESPQPVITDALVDEVARRVLERLAPGVARDVVVQVVSEIAERLVREEIARIRSKQS